MIVLGLGFSSSAASADLVSAIDAAISGQKLRRADIGALASADFKRGARCLAEAANELGVDVLFASETALGRVENRIVTRSARSREHSGSDCLCEAAALAVLCENAKLVMPRLVCGPVTCAIALGEPQ